MCGHASSTSAERLSLVPGPAAPAAAATASTWAGVARNTSCPATASRYEPGAGAGAGGELLAAGGDGGASDSGGPPVTAPRLAARLAARRTLLAVPGSATPGTMVAFGSGGPRREAAGGLQACDLGLLHPWQVVRDAKLSLPFTAAGQSLNWHARPAACDGVEEAVRRLGARSFSMAWKACIASMSPSKRLPDPPGCALAPARPGFGACPPPGGAMERRGGAQRDLHPRPPRTAPAQGSDVRGRGARFLGVT